MKKHYLTAILTCGLLGILVVAKAQSINSGTINNEGGIIDNNPIWLNTEDGIYIGSNHGVFNHFGPASQTFINNGVYQAGTGHKDIFKGPHLENGIQEIGGLKRPNFFDVDFDNGAAKQINITNIKGISIAGILNFQNGITTTLRSLNYNGAIQFEQGASFKNGNTDAQHVNGYVSKLGNTSFIFPVGSGTDLRTVQISAPANETAHLSIAWIAGDPDLTADPSDVSPFHTVSSVKGNIISVSKLGQWDWIAAVPSLNALTVNVSIPDLSGFTTAANLRLVGWDGTGWIDLSGNSTATANIENSLLQGTIPTNKVITALGIGNAGPALPVQLISFTAAINERTNTLLSWTTASEVNNKYFQVEHSLDAKNFEKIGQVEGKGTFSLEKTDYSFYHKLSLPVGNHYYRLKQVDFNESYTYSILRSVNFGELVTSIYPNPATSQLTVEIADWNNIKSVEMYNAAGQNIYLSEEKRPILLIDVRSLPAAMYLIKIKYNQGSVISQKVMVVK